MSICVGMRVLIKEDIFIRNLFIRNNKPGGTLTELVLRAVNSQHLITMLRRAHSL